MSDQADQQQPEKKSRAKDFAILRLRSLSIGTGYLNLSPSAPQHSSEEPPSLGDHLEDIGFKSGGDYFEVVPHGDAEIHTTKEAEKWLGEYAKKNMEDGDCETFLIVQMSGRKTISVEHTVSVNMISPEVLPILPRW